MSAVLQVRDLVTRFHGERTTVNAVTGVSFDLQAGEALAIVGESGSGKTVTALSLMRLVPSPGTIESGEVLLRGRDVLGLSSSQLLRVRGREIAMIFQDPATSLNPVLTIGRQLDEALRWHTDVPKTTARRRALELLERVGIPDPAGRLDDYPHRLSGGQRQRVMIAMALACEPAVLIADEPTTALDVTIQAQIVELMRELQAELGMALIWITHDLALIAGLVDRVAVMYAGTIVEQAPVAEIFREPRHPYTLGLLRSLPRMHDEPGGRLGSIPGRPPDMTREFKECPFAPRCDHVADRCRAERPGLLPVAPGHASACWLHDELAVPSDSGGIER